MPQYVSQRKLIKNSVAAMLAAIEIYNKPQVSYREETTVVLLVNAWELALKAALLKAKCKIYYPKKRNQPRRSLSIKDAVIRMQTAKLWPKSIDGPALQANLESIITYRDQAIHLYTSKEIPLIMHSYFQSNVLSYRDFMLQIFNIDLADKISWTLLPLSPKLPAEIIPLMRVDMPGKTTKNVQVFLDGLRATANKAISNGASGSGIAIGIDFALISVKHTHQADITAAVSNEAPTSVSIRKVDSAQTHPYTMTSMLEKVNTKRPGASISSYDFAAVCWKYKLREKPEYAWKHPKNNSPYWSEAAVKFFTSLPEEELKALREEYRHYRFEKRALLTS